MQSVRLVLAERCTALTLVLKAGLEIAGFDVKTVGSSRELPTSVADARALLLDEELLGVEASAIDPEIFVIVMGSECPASVPYLWLRKPFDPELLLRFLHCRFFGESVRENRRAEYRHAVDAQALVFDERTTTCTYAAILDATSGGCSLFLTQGAGPGDPLHLCLHLRGRDFLRKGFARNDRLALTPDGELRRVVGVELFAE